MISQHNSMSQAIGEQALNVADELAGEHLDDLIDPYDEAEGERDAEQNSSAEPAVSEDERDISWYRQEVAANNMPALF